MTEGYEIKQFIKTVNKGWLETIATCVNERTALMSFDGLEKEFPDEHFELFKITHNEVCLKWSKK